MKLIKPFVEFPQEIDGDSILKILEKVARICYKSEDKITENTDSAKKLLKVLLTKQHASILEFIDIQVKFTCSRACANEIVRHRLGSYAQESTRYCNYTKDKFNNQLTFIIPEWALLEEGEYGKDNISSINNDQALEFATACSISEQYYNTLIRDYGCKPEEARDILPLCLKTEINVKYNLREWRHFFELRCSNAAHPEIRMLAKEVLKKFHDEIPLIFDDLYERYIEQPNSKS